MNNNQEKYHNQIDAYFRNELSDEERILYEKMLQEDPELFEEFEIHKELYAQIDEEDWVRNTFSVDDQEVEDIQTYYRSVEAQKLKDSIQRVQKNYQMQSKKVFSSRGIFISLVAAASVALLIIFYTINSGYSTQELYAEYSSWDDLPSLTSRSNDDQLSLGQSLFEEGKYQKAITIFESFLTTNKEIYPPVIIYSGVTALELNQYQEALSYFDQLIQSEAIDQSKGYWYKVLVYLKQDDRNNAITVLKIIVKDENNFKYKEALKLINELN